MRTLHAVVVVGVVLASADASAFCGFFVAKADAKLFNKASQVVLVRDGDKTVMTMANDYQGKVKDFAMVIPVPTKLEKEQIHIGDMKFVDHVDAYTTPRLAEYYDQSPCPMPERDYDLKSESVADAAPAPAEKPMSRGAKKLGVTIEASYTVGEYDILILSAKQSDGLITWLNQEGYKVPKGADDVVASYLKQKMKWFVAKVNLKEHDKLGGGKLRPIQVAYESPKFMLPIRLGTVNADGTQDLFVYAISKTGRVEVANYRNVKLPTDKDVPVYVKEDFGTFYKSLFSKLTTDNDMRAVVTEYAWSLNINCDPCSADPLLPSLAGLGVWWAKDVSDYHAFSGGLGFVTRMHVRYDRDHFPEDLVFQETSDQQLFQGRYVVRHPFTGEMNCKEADGYRKQVWDRQHEEAKTLASLTGWKVGDIKKKMSLADKPPKGGGKSWYQNIWGD